MQALGRKQEAAEAGNNTSGNGDLIGQRSRDAGREAANALKDIVAAVVVQRADVLAQFNDPITAFGGKGSITDSDWPNLSAHGKSDRGRTYSADVLTMSATSPRPHRFHNPALLAMLLSALPLTSASAETSVCYGTVAEGRLAGGVPLPAQGINYVPYSSLGVSLGRTYVHRAVRDIVVEAYKAAQTTVPDRRFMYGETGLADGGQFKPHRTHQAGLSVDFMVPIIDSKGKSVLLPTNTLNKFGYGLEFDANGALDDLRIDFEAMAEHLYQLAEAAKRHHVPIQRVIFQKELVTLLLRTKRGNYLRDNVVFMKATPWVKHDEHYHVDFSLPCRPLAEYRWHAK